MEAKVHSLEGSFEERHDAPELRVAPIQRLRWWKLVLVAVLLAIVLALAANAFLYSPQEDAPMQVEPQAIAV